jgi:hypothetical protein
MDRGDPSYEGQVSYNRFLLAIYDPFVLGIRLVRCGGLRSRRSSSAIVGISDAGISTSVPGRGTSSRRPRRRPDRDHPARPEPVNQVYQRADGIHRVGSSRFSPMLEEASNYGRSLPTKEEFRVTGGELRSAHRYQGGLVVGVVGLPPW